jgi:hypothetical protein
MGQWDRFLSDSIANQFITDLLNNDASCVAGAGQGTGVWPGQTRLLLPGLMP